MASSATAPTPLENLPARPPTPPREQAHQEPTELLLKSRSNGPSPLNPRLSLHTPPNANSSASSAAANSTNPGSSRARKRVGWSGHTEYREPPDYKNAHRLHKSPSLSAPSSASSKPLKGILKPSSSPNPLASSLSNQLDGTEKQINITEMLDSTIKQLAGSDQVSKRDAYMMLTSALKASNNLPDRVALQDKMSLLMQFIQRDVTAKKGDGHLDTSLITKALQLLATFLHFHAIASTITTDFSIFIIDHAIRLFDDPSSPKDVVRHLMQVVAFQNFPPKVMTADRVGRLVASLHKMEGHLKGKSIVMSRIQIYKRLVKQSRSHMAIHTDWLKDMFTDMLSTLRIIGTEATSLGMEAGYSMRSGNQLRRKVTEILQTTDDDQAYIDFYIQRLSAMVKDKQQSSAVPQIWSVVTLFLLCPLDRWEYYGPWFSLIQTAFNTSDGETKQEANYAWNRYVYLSLLDNKPTPKLLAALCQPLMSQLRRKPNTKNPEEGNRLRRTVIGGICNLYYYAFRPGNGQASPPEVSWDVAVQPVIAQLVGLDGTREARPDDILQASRILVRLLDVSTPIVWREDRIAELPPVKPEELPSIESKWIRKNSERVFKAVGPVMERKFLDLANKESLAYRLWQAIVGSVAAASSKDIKVSEDTAKFLACAFGLLSQIWTKGCPDDEELLVSKFYPSVRNFINILVDGLGRLPFTEKKLCMTVPNTFEPVATPSHRPDRLERGHGVVFTALQHLFTMLSVFPQGGSDDEAFSNFFQSVFEPFFVGKSDKIRLLLTRELIRMLPQDISSFAPWSLGAQAVQLSLPLDVPQGLPNSDKLPGPGFREVISFLERGLASHPNLPSKCWLALFDTFSQHVTAAFGDAGRTIVVIEPLAKSLVEYFQPNSPLPSTRVLEATRAVIDSAKLPRDRQALDVARRRVWGAAPVAPKGTSADPFDDLYKLGDAKLRYCYDNLSDLGAETTIAPFIQSIGAFVVGSFPLAGFKTLSKLQAGLSLCFQDERAQLKLNDDSALARIIRDLWTEICAELVRRGHLDKAQFGQVENLLTATFKSKHRFIVNKAAETWNAIVKDEENPECSDSLKSAVSSLRSRVDVLLPGTGKSNEGFGAQAMSFLESQDDSNPVALSLNASHDPQAPVPPTTAVSAKPSQASTSRKRPLEMTPELEKTRSSKRATRSTRRTSTPRLRHDNSQIRFEPIASSSPIPGESQHLTERQKEVRERQKQNAALYSDVPSSSPHKAQEVSPGKTGATASSNNVANQDATPERTASYGDLISSTPTPRRGQVIPIEVDNDPPSSPPEPRPYPLLSEIQSRSRTSNSLENWDFSSPPSSPVTSRQQVVQDVEPPHVALTNDSTQTGTSSQAKGRKGRTTKKPTRSPDVPSSAPDTKVQNALSPRTTRSQAARSSAPTTPRRNPTPLANGERTPKSGEDEFVDAKSSPERSSSPALPEMLSQDTASEEPSFAFSEGDDSQLMKFVVELESRKGSNLPFEKHSSVSPQKQPSQEAVMECITVQTSSPSVGRGDGESSENEESSQAVIPSTPAEPSERDSQGPQAEKKRKRKRGKNSDNRRKKKRRSLDDSITAVEGNKSHAGEGGTCTPTNQAKDLRPAGVRTRRSARQEQQHKPETPADQKQDTEAVQRASKEEGDTDEELESQLMTESNAASGSRNPRPDDAQVEGPSMVEDSMDVGSMNKAAVQQGTQGEGDEQRVVANDADSILGTLRGGLDGLRNASLSRPEFNEIEDILMDIKRELHEAERRGRTSV